MEGLIKIHVEGRDRHPVATCDLDIELECRGKDLERSVLGWIKAFCDKQGIPPHKEVTIERYRSNIFKFSITEDAEVVSIETVTRPLSH